MKSPDPLIISYQGRQLRVRHEGRYHDETWSVHVASRLERGAILVDAGTDSVERFEIRATQVGRRIELTTGRGVVELTEVTRTGPRRAAAWWRRRNDIEHRRTPR